MEDWLEHLTRNASLHGIDEAELPALLLNYIDTPERKRVSEVLGGVRFRAELNNEPFNMQMARNALLELYKCSDPERTIKDRLKKLRWENASVKASDYPGTS